MDSGLDEINKFIKDLGLAIADEMGSVKETDLNRPSAPIEMWVKVKGMDTEFPVEASIDVMGRVILPPDDKFSKATHVILAGKLGVKAITKVHRVEPRYTGQEVSAWVCYMEKEGGKL